MICKILLRYRISRISRKNEKILIPMKYAPWSLPKDSKFYPFFLFHSFSRLFTLSGRSQCRNVTPRKLKSSNEFDLVMSSKNHRDREKLFPSLSFVSMTVNTSQASRKDSKFLETNVNSLKFYSKFLCKNSY